jgi:hypothetical protein
LIFSNSGPNVADSDLDSEGFSSTEGCHGDGDGDFDSDYDGIGGWDDSTGGEYISGGDGLGEPMDLDGARVDERLASNDDNETRSSASDGSA